MEDHAFERSTWDELRPRGRPFVKMHGLRNHFVIVDARETPFRPPAADVERICDVQCGVGGDQLVVLEPARNGRDVTMRLYNVDGREVGACGNATRCVAWLLMEESSRDAVVIETLAGSLKCVRDGDRRVRCDMGAIKTDWRSVPLAEAADTLHLPVGSGPLEDAVALSVGNPHAVYFVGDVDGIDLDALAPEIQRHRMFPQQVNVGVAQVVDATRLRLRVYERGAGLTTACGSGACAAVYAAHARGMIDAREAVVSMPAGEVFIRLREGGHVDMSGPVAYCYSGFL